MTLSFPLGTLYPYRNSALVLALSVLVQSHAALATDCGKYFSPDQTVILVDPLSFRAGEDLPSIVRKLGGDPIILIETNSNPFLIDRLAGMGENDSSILAKATDTPPQAFITRSGRQIDPSKVVAVIPSTDNSIGTADKIAKGLGLNSNAVSAESPRETKSNLYQAVKSAGLRVPESITVENSSLSLDFALPAWAQRILEDNNGSGLVVKPNSSAGSDNVFVVKNKQELKNALEKISKELNAYGRQNKQTVIQEYLTGPEYIVDSISSTQTINGRKVTAHLLVGGWLYHREPSSAFGVTPLIDYVEWVPQLPEGLWDYTKKVLDAAGIEFGAGHSEIFMTKVGPTIVDLGARLPGGLPRLALEATGSVDSRRLLIESYISPETIFGQQETLGNGYPTQQYAEVVFLNVFEDHKGFNGSPEQKLKELKLATLSDYRIFQNGSNGKPSVSKDVTNALMRVHLVGEKSLVESERKRLKKAHNRYYFLLQ